MVVVTVQFGVFTKHAEHFPIEINAAAEAGVQLDAACRQFDSWTGNRALADDHAASIVWIAKPVFASEQLWPKTFAGHYGTARTTSRRRLSQHCAVGGPLAPSFF